MKDKLSRAWIPLWVDKWIFGSTRIELEPAERGVFIDLMVLGAKDSGYIRANEVTPYYPVQLAGILNIPVDLLTATIGKCIKHGKLEEKPKGIYRLLHWEKYQFTDRWKREIIKPTSTKSEATSSPAEPIKEKKIKENKRKECIRPQRVFTRPTQQDVAAYCQERGNHINPDRFISHYEAVGWKIGKSPMKDWKAAVRTWEQRDRENTPQTPQRLKSGPSMVDKVAKDLETTHRVNAYHAKNTAGGRCAFCGRELAKMETCTCPAYAAGLKEVYAK